MPALDGVRGIAVLMVLATHLTIYNPANKPEAVLYAVLGTGWLGVDLFFVLSGFLITGILLDTRGSIGYFRVFYARRFLRLFPVLYATLAVVFLVVPTLGFAKSVEYLRTLETQAWIGLTRPIS